MKIVTYNTQLGILGYDFIKSVLDFGDIVLLQRIPRELYQKLKQDPGFTPFFVNSFLPAKQYDVGLVILSRHSCECKSHVLPLAGEHKGIIHQGYVMAEATLRLKERKFSVFNALPSFANEEDGFTWQMWEKQVARIFEIADGKNAIIGGDFHLPNSDIRWSSIDKKDYQDATGNVATFRIKAAEESSIDRFFLSKEFTDFSYSVKSIVPEFPNDLLHYPVILDIDV